MTRSGCWRALLTATGLALAAGPVFAQGVHLEIDAVPDTTAPGDTITVDLNIFQADDEFNAFEVNLGYDPAHLTYIPGTNVKGPLMTSACATTFGTFNDSGTQLEITLSLLCADVFVTGPGVVYTVQFEADPGPAITNLTCEAGTRFLRAGFEVLPLECVDAVVVCIDSSATGIGIGADPAPALSLGTPWPNPHPGGGTATFDFTLPRADDVRFDLFDAGGRRVSFTSPRHYATAGRHSLVWDPGSLGSGIYFVRLTTGSGGAVQRGWVVLR